jgi:hypothetical protein
VGVLDRFEKGVERAVHGVFAKAFKSEVQPVELASALRREADTSAAVVARDRTLVPNAFLISLGSADHERLTAWEDSLVDELAEAVTAHARQQRYSFIGPVTVRFEEDEELDTGVFTVRGARVKGRVAPATSATATAGHPVLDVDGRKYQLTSDRTVLGRGSEADIVVDDPGVSRQHAEIRLDGGSAVLRDLGSTNGTFVDGERAGTARLVDGSTITMGRTRIRFSSRTGRTEDDES